MKRLIRTPSVKAAATIAKDEHTKLVASQIADFMLECEQWKKTIHIDMLPQARAQVTYLYFVNLAIGDHVMLKGENEDIVRFEHVRLQVVGAASFALPSLARSQYNYPRVYVRVELDMPPLQRLSRWVPAERLQRKTHWKDIL